MILLTPFSIPLIYPQLMGPTNSANDHRRHAQIYEGNENSRNSNRQCNINANAQTNAWKRNKEKNREAFSKHNQSTLISRDAKRKIKITTPNPPVHQREYYSGIVTISNRIGIVNIQLPCPDNLRVVPFPMGRALMLQSGGQQPIHPINRSSANHPLSLRAVPLIWFLKAQP